MNHEEKFNAWKARKRDVRVRPDFAVEVMRQIRKIEDESPKIGLILWLERLFANPLAQSAALFVAANIGLIRLWLVLSTILSP